MGMIAAAMFVALFAFGAQGIGWVDTDGHVQLALFMSFIFGIIAGFRTRGS